MKTTQQPLSFIALCRTILLVTIGVQLSYFSANAQYTYSASPSIGTYVSCPSTCAGWQGGEVRMRVTVVNASTFRFEISKCSGTFVSSGRFYVGWDTDMGCNNLGSTYVNVSAGASSATIDVPASWFNQGNNSYWNGAYYANSNGVTYYAGFIQITRTPTQTCTNPTSNTPGSVTQNASLLAWSGGTGPFELQVYRNGSWSSEYTGSNNYYNVSGLSCGTYYDWRVRATCTGTWVNGSGFWTSSCCTSPTSPTSATATSTTITAGQSTTLQVQGGSLGSASNWVWYTGGCGGTQVGTGAFLPVSPTVSTIYYVNASACGSTTTCRSVSITVNAACTAPTSPTSATATSTTITAGQSTTLQVQGGSLGSASNWIWYTGGCGGTQVGTGASLSVNPTVSTIYYVNASACGSTTTCRSVSITVNPACTAPTSPTSATATSTTITAGQSTTLQVQGGSLGSASNWIWYTGGCGGTQVGTGASLSVNPTVNTIYYVNASACGSTTTCRSVSITVNPACTSPTSPTSATATSTTITAGQSTTLQVQGGSLGSASNWVWYTGGCGGTQVGTGASLSVNPTVSTIYYVNASACGSTTTCRSVSITVNPACTAPSNITISTTPSGGQVTEPSNINLIATVGTGTAPFQYQWQRSTNGGASWTNVWINQNSYPINPTSASMSGYQFRCQVTNSCGSGTSNISIITVCPSWTNGSIDGIEHAPMGTNNNYFDLSVNGLGGNATYQWHFQSRLYSSITNCGHSNWSGLQSLPNSVSGYNTGSVRITNAFLSSHGTINTQPIDPPTCLQQYQFYCTVSNSCGSNYQYGPFQINRMFVADWELTGSNLSNARIKLISGSNSLSRRSDESGRLTNWGFNAFSFDSITAEYPGYHKLRIPVIHTIGARSIPMLRDGNTTNLIRYPRVNFNGATVPMNFSGTLAFPFAVQGENITDWQVFAVNDTFGLVQPALTSSGGSPNGLLTQLAFLPQERKWYAFMLTGADTAIIYKFVDMYDIASTYQFNIQTPASLYGTEVYYDGQYLRQVQQSSTYPLPTGAHTFTFKRLGYTETSLQVSSAGTHVLNMTPINHSSLTDSIIHLAVNSTAPRYWKSSTILSNDNTIDVSLKQFDLSEASLSALLPASRVFRFRRLANTASLRAAIVLDQPEFLSNDSVYLLEVKNWNQLTKHLPDETNFCSYDSAFQKLLLDNINLTANTTTLDFVLLRRKAPLVLSPTITAMEDESFSISLYDFFSDPDSIPLDMSFAVTATGNGISAQIIGDSVFVSLSPEFNGNTSLTLTATHDWLTVSNSISFDVAPVNDPPVLAELSPVELCSGSSSNVNLSGLVSDVDHPLSSVTLNATVIGTNNQNVSTSDLNVSVNALELQFSSNVQANTVFTVAIIASDGLDNSLTQNILVNVVPEISLEIGQSSPVVCNGQTMQLWGDGATSYEWLLSGLNISNSDTLELPLTGLPFSISLYNLTLFGTNGACNSSAQIAVPVVDPPVVQIEAVSTELCQGDSVLLNASGAITYDWQSIEPFTIVASNQIWAVPQTTSSYEVSGTNSAGCNSSASTTIIVNETPASPVISEFGSGLQSSYSSGNQWYLNGVLLVGESGQVLSNPEAGNYTVEHTDFNGCSSVSEPFVVAITGVSSSSVSPSFEVFPNPNNGSFTVQYSGTENLSLQLLDALGRIVSTENLNTGTPLAEFHGVASGIYLLEGRSNNELLLKRVVVK